MEKPEPRMTGFWLELLDGMIKPVNGIGKRESRV